MEERVPKKAKLNSESLPLVDLVTIDDIDDDVFTILFGDYDVPEMRKFAGVNINMLITANDGFIRGYNMRVRPPVCLFNHCTTQEYERYGVLYGYRVSVSSQLSIPIQPKFVISLNMPPISLSRIGRSLPFSRFFRQAEQEMETVVKVLQPGPLGIIEHKFSAEEIEKANATVKRAVMNWKRNAIIERNRPILKDYIN